MTFFLKIGIEVGTYFVKKAPNFEIVWPASATPRALNVKGVYEVSYSCYGQINGTVCISFYSIEIFLSAFSIVTVVLLVIGCVILIAFTGLICIGLRKY